MILLRQCNFRVVYMHYLTPRWTHFGLLRNLSYCLHVTSGVKFYPGLKDRGGISTPGEISCFLTCKQKINFNRRWKLFFVVKYTENTISFHPGVKDACKQKIFHQETKFHPGWNNACKLPLWQIFESICLLNWLGVSLKLAFSPSTVK